MSSSLAFEISLPPSRSVCGCRQVKPAAARLLHKRDIKISSHIPSRRKAFCSQLSKLCLSCHMMTQRLRSEPLRQAPLLINQPPSLCAEIFYEDINICLLNALKLLPGSMGGRLQSLVSAGSNKVLLIFATALLLQPLPCIAAELVASLRDGEIVELGAVDLPPIPTEFPPLPDLKLPDYKKVVLPNGLKVLLLEDHELGLVGGQILVKGGGMSDPIDKVGLAAVTGAVQRGGGTTALPGDDLNARLESMAARIESGAGVSEMSVAFRCLREDMEEVFGLFTDVVLHPAMPQDKLDLVQRQLLGVLARRNDDPGGIASRELPKLLYGAASPYARVPEPHGVKAINPSDLLAFHAATYRPDQAVLGLWGDFDSTAAQNLILSTLGSWGGGPPPLPPNAPPQVSEEAGISSSAPGLYLIDRPGLTQGYVRMAELGTSLDDPDVFALDVLNSELNGFGGRLFNEGAFVAGGESRVTSIPQFVKAVQHVLNDVMTEPPTPEELSQAKDSSLNSFVFNFADSGAQLSRIMTYELFGIDQDYIFRYKQGIEETTGDDVLQVAKRHLHPDKQAILIVTDVDSIRPSLEDLGLPMFDLTID